MRKNPSYTALLGPTRLLISEKSATYTIKWSCTIIWQVRVPALFSQYFSICLDSTDDDDIVIEDSKDIITVKQMMKLFANHPMLESFQLCCRWLMTSKQIIQEAGENSHVLWHR